jgi:vancomycin resistance protein YoaR
MRTTTAASTSISDLSTFLVRALALLAGGVVLFFTLLSLLGMGYAYSYSGQIIPGVSVAGVDLSGMEPINAAVLLAQELNYPQTGAIVLEAALTGETSRVWETRPADLGLSLNLEETVNRAYMLGRGGNPLRRVFELVSAWHSGRDLAPVMNYDEYAARAFLAGIAAEIDRPVLEASLNINGLDVVAVPGQIGRRIDLAATMTPLEEMLRGMTDGLFPLVIEETSPAILDAEMAAQQARQVLNAPLALLVPEAAEGDPGPWTVEPQQLANMLVIERVEGAEGDTIQVRLDAEKLRPLLTDVAQSLSRSPANARFIFNDETRQLDLILPAVIGRALNIDATLQAIQQELPSGNHNLQMVVDTTKPEITNDVTAEQLGIRELVSQHTSYFYGSSSPRIQNISTASARFHGVLVPPGATFSMADVLGDVSLDNGYAEALIIFGDRTVEGVGGGVCQVSTTLFRTAFLAGYPIVERHSHAYRVGYYEQTAGGQINSNLAGLDATVFVPLVDFKFVNDTPNWLLMETYVNERARKLTWKFYSTSDGRSVEWDTSGVQNVVSPPPPQYIENPKLDAGEIEQIDWEVEGADVTVTRVVYRNGEVYFQDQFVTHYEPWRAIYEYGPGTEIPEG